MTEILTRQKHRNFLWIESKRNLLFMTEEFQGNGHFRILSNGDNELQIENVHFNGRKTLITLKNDIDFKSNIHLQLHGSENRFYARFSHSLLNSEFYYDGDDLGANFNGKYVELKLWSPPAENVKVIIYRRDAKSVLGVKDLIRKNKGVWETRLDPEIWGIKDLDGFYYQYEVDVFSEKRLVLDPYAKSMAAFDPGSDDLVGKAAFVRLEESPAKHLVINQANELDFIAYEAHIRDFSIDPGLDIDPGIKGTYKGFEKIIPYIQKLGVTHIQFMPLQNFFTAKEDLKTYQDGTINAENINYNWGYDPHNYFSPEGWYSQNPHDAHKRIEEVRGLVDAVHKHGMGVILDVVYNHVFENTSLEAAAPGCYFRTDEFGNISFNTGAGPTVESRNRMARKLIVDSLLFWRNFYGVDGFRFDLMGFLDHETMLLIRKKLGEDVILYGEAWDLTDLPHEIATTKTNLPEGAYLGAFNDSFRDSYTGTMAYRGFVQGEFNEVFNVKAGIVGALFDYPAPYGEMTDNPYRRFAKTPAETLNYLTIHDGFTLWDKLNLSVSGDVHKRKQLMKMALAMLMTSQGKVIVHGGVEMARSKPLSPNDPNPDRAHTSEYVDPEDGVEFFHENTYKSPDVTNMIDWGRAGNFQDLTNYFKGLVKLRRSTPAFRYMKSKSIKNGLRFLGVPENKMLKTIGNYAGYESFSDPGLSELTIRFINAHQSVRGKRLFFAGEIHSREAVSDASKNPGKNPFFVDINNDGEGSIVFSREQIDVFDLRAWSNSDNLQFKLTEIPGEWKSPHGAYTQMGHNLVEPRGILVGNIAVIDLAIVNHSSGHIPRLPSHFVAYIIDNTMENDVSEGYQRLPVREILVIHNVDSKEFSLPVEKITNPSDWKVFVDNNAAGVVPIDDSDVVITHGLITVPGNSTVVVGH